MRESKKVSWNASQGLIMEISNRRTYANTFFINGDIRKAFNTLTAIKQSVIQSFNQDERTNLENLERLFSRLSSVLNKSSSMSFNVGTRRSFHEANNIAKRIYAKYNDMLMDLLDDRGYLIGEQTDASKMRF